SGLTSNCPWFGSPKSFLNGELRREQTTTPTRAASAVSQDHCRRPRGYRCRAMAGADADRDYCGRHSHFIDLFVGCGGLCTGFLEPERSREYFDARPRFVVMLLDHHSAHLAIIAVHTPV